MNETRKTPRMLSWWIGLALIVPAEIYVAYKLVICQCETPLVIDFIILAVIPVVYLWLMYLALKSQP